MTIEPIEHQITIKVTPSTYEQRDGVTPVNATAPQANPRTIVKSHPDKGTHMMTEIDNGVFVAWVNCSKCSKTTPTCMCPAGPTEPPYIKEWRENRFKESRRYQPPKPLTDLTDRELLAYLLQQYDLVVAVHDGVRMDTPEDVLLHDKGIATFRKAAESVRERLAHPVVDVEPATEPPAQPTDDELIGGGIDDALAAVMAARDTMSGEVGATGYVQPVGTVPVDELNPEPTSD